MSSSDVDCSAGTATPVPILAVGIPDRYLDRLRAQRRNVIAVDAVANLPDDARSAQILLYWDKDRAHAERIVAGLPALRWMHVPWIGVERLMFGRIRRGDVTLTNSAGSASIPVAEYALGALLAISKNLCLHWASQQKRSWRQDAPTEELGSKRLLIVGYGGIGRALGRRASALGMSVQAVASAARREDDIDVHAPDDLDGLLPKADFVVLALPSTERTRRLFGPDRLRRMAPTAWLLNVGRGDAIDEAALLQAVREGVIRGAWLDVVADEPLGPDSPLWNEPGILITPHVSSWTQERFDRSFEIFMRNLAADARGEPLTNVVAPVS